MKTVEKCVLFGSLLGFFTATTHAATYTAASCNQSDVNAIINGPTHSAVNGDTIVIPAGACTWTSGLSISVGITVIGTGTPNTTPSTFGAGTLSTVIVDNAGSSNSLFAFSGITYGNTVRISTLDIEPQSSSTALWSPISVAGACNSSGCPNLRVDNIGFGLTTPLTEGGNGTAANWMIRTDNVFGVIDHCTIPTGSNVELLNANHSAYLGTGAYGDNSWAQPDSFGGANVLYMENNSVYVNGQAVNDCDIGPVNGAIGGCRIAGRFNSITENGAFSTFYVHGLDTDGRPQGGRQIEAYGNKVVCSNTGGCNDGLVTYRSGTGFVFGNMLSSTDSGFYNLIAGIVVYRTILSEAPWGACGGSSAYDTNDGVTYYTGSVTTTGSGVLTMTDSSKTWKTNQFIPSGAPYSVYDSTQGFWSEITGNTSDTLTIAGPISESGWTGFNNGDSYQILRATVCADQGGRGAGNYVSAATPSSASALLQALDPIYEWDNMVSGSLFHGNLGSDTGRTIANRDWYTDNSNGSPQEQTSPTSPFNGTSGVGFGTLANRPATCTAGVGYFATDQGNWNQSGNGFGQGQLFVCNATNTWTTYYTPYTYPHPLTQSGTTPATPKGSGAGKSIGTGIAFLPIMNMRIQ